MELIEGSETSVNHNRTPGKYPKEYIQDSKHGESMKSRRKAVFLTAIDTSISHTLKYIRTALSWVITQQVLVIPCRRFGTTYRSHLYGSRIQTY